MRSGRRFNSSVATAAYRPSLAGNTPAASAKRMPDSTVLESCISARRRSNAYRFGALEWLVDAQRLTHDVGIARSLQGAFVDLWVSSSGELLIDPKYYPGPALAEVAGVQRFVHLDSSPADDDQSMAYFYLLPIFSARASIYLASPFFIPDNYLLEALVEKARARVDVRLMLPSKNADNWITRARARRIAIRSCWRWA